MQVGSTIEYDTVTRAGALIIGTTPQPQALDARTGFSPDRSISHSHQFCTIHLRPTAGTFSGHSRPQRKPESFLPITAPTENLDQCVHERFQPGNRFFANEEYIGFKRIQ